MLPVGLKLSYGVGHVLNDLCASMWFTYLLIFFHFVMGFNSLLSGLVLFVGQLADGLATPFVGLFSDRGDNFWICRYGRRKTWHLIGTVCVLGTFPFIFSPCIDCQTSHQWAQMIYYCAFVVVFQFGWAATQVSHLSLVPDLTPVDSERTSLLAIRYTFTVLANILVYIITWAVFHMTSDQPNAQVSPHDMVKFQYVTYLVVSIGLLTSLVFHVGVKETERETLLGEGDGRRIRTGVRPGQLFMTSSFYQVALLYMVTRLFANISQVMIPLYLHEYLSLGAQSLAILPLVMFISSFVTSTIIKPLNTRFGRRFAYLSGSIIGVGVSLWVQFGKGEFYATYLIFGVAILFGCASSIMIVTSLGITADMIGSDCDNGAFIYGFMSFSDKVSNGVAVMLIQSWECNSCSVYYRNSLSYVCGGAALFGILIVSLMRHPDAGNQGKEDMSNKTECEAGGINNPNLTESGEPATC